MNYAELVSVAGGWTPRDVAASRMRFREVMQGLAEGRLDVGVILAGYPALVLRETKGDIDTRLVPIQREAALRVRARYPFFKPAVIPRGTYGADQGDVPTLGIEILLLCVEDLHADLVYQLTRTLFEDVPSLPDILEAARRVDPDLAPATPIPLHPGAARYYRERELFR